MSVGLCPRTKIHQVGKSGRKCHRHDAVCSHLSSMSRLCSLDVFSWLLLCRKMEKELVRAQEGERKGAEAILALRDIVSMLEADERNARVQKKE